MEPDIAQVEKSIFEWIEQNFEDVFVIEVKCHKGKQNLLRVTVDKDKGISIGDCALINRKLQEWLLCYPVFLENYRIEVSSPGLSEPFKVFRQYTKNIGREVIVTLLNGEKIKGTLVAAHAEQNNITLQTQPNSYKNKNATKSNNTTITTTIPLKEIKHCFIDIKI
ncbi:MAG: hypothetical protein RML72_13025 [Bacteroidia bacterium]|nr:hypothetical protein [Bacteroidia bacterium]MDW8159781.1 hypothetical protein [Bacteroidia bacterium]